MLVEMKGSYGIEYKTLMNIMNHIDLSYYMANIMPYWPAAGPEIPDVDLRVYSVEIWHRFQYECDHRGGSDGIGSKSGANWSDCDFVFPYNKQSFALSSYESARCYTEWDAEHNMWGQYPYFRSSPFHT